MKLAPRAVAVTGDIFLCLPRDAALLLMGPGWLWLGWDAQKFYAQKLQ